MRIVFTACVHNKFLDESMVEAGRTKWTSTKTTLACFNAITNNVCLEMKNQEQMTNWSGHQQNSHKLRLTQENCSHHPVNGELYIGRTGFYHLNPSSNIRNTKSETGKHYVPIV